MKIFIDKKNGGIRFQVEDDVDINNVRKIAAVINMEGWKVLQDYLQIGREAIIESGKESAKKRTTLDLSPEKWAMLDGFDNCSSVAETLVANAKAFVENIETQAKEEVHGHDEGN